MSPHAPTATPLQRRSYRDPADLARIQETLREGWRLRGPRSQAQPGDVEWWMAGNADAGTDWSARISLWEDPADGSVRGWAWYTPPGDLDWYVLPSDDEALRRSQLDWFFEQVEAASKRGEAPERLTAWALDDDAVVRRLLEAEGFAPVAGGTTHRAYRFHGRRVAEPTIPDDYSLWSVSGETDLGRRVEVHRAAFAPSRMTLDRYAAVMASPSYRADLDLVCVAPNGSFAAFCLLWFDPETSVGLLEPVGTHPDHQRRGLATAVCREALSRLKAIGAEWAVVLCDSDDVGPNRLYDGLGFREVMRSERWGRAT